MKKNYIILFLFAVVTFPALAQTFYVEPTEKGFEKEIIDKMKYEGYKIAEKKEDSNYIVSSLVDGQYNAFKLGNMFHGYVKISDTKTGDELARTKVVGKSPSAINGFQAGPKIMSTIAEKYLIPELKKVLSIYKNKQSSQ